MNKKRQAWFRGFGVTTLGTRIKGGPGSGNFAHGGRPGMRGGSSARMQNAFMGMPLKDLKGEYQTVTDRLRSSMPSGGGRDALEQKKQEIQRAADDAKGVPYYHPTSYPGVSSKKVRETLGEAFEIGPLKEEDLSYIRYKKTPNAFVLEDEGERLGHRQTRVNVGHLHKMGVSAAQFEGFMRHKGAKTRKKKDKSPVEDWG